jgi:hypothetical protein
VIAVLLLAALAQEVPDFERDVIPVLTRAGCNAGSCHGSAKGQGGFRLSLQGYDVGADFDAVAQEFRSRRIHRVKPEASLLLRKGLGKVDHEGGRALVTGAQVVLDWIRAGAPRSTRSALLVEVRAEPGDLRLEAGAAAPLRVRSTESDGQTRDVTTLALFSSNDPSIASVDEHGRVKAVRPGGTTLLARYSGFVVPVNVLVPYGPGRDSAFRPVTFVDEALQRHWTSLGLVPAPRADDAAFLRRAHLDLIGTLPTPAEVRSFLAAPDRGALIDRLLARPEFESFWTYKLAQVLMIGPKAFPPSYPAWIRSRLDAPLPETVRTLVTASGTEAPAAFFSVSSDPRVMMEFTLQSFHGFRMQCAQCHNHPLERFPQDDYHALASSYARVRHDPGVVLSPRGELTHPRTGKVVISRFDGADRRVPFADWLVSSPAFSRAWANRLWAELFGRGLVHPVDDLRISNPSSVPGLLDTLAAEFAREPRLKPFLALLARSAAYGLAADGNAEDRHFAQAIVKPLPPEVLADAIASAAGSGGPRSIERLDPGAGTAFLEDLGRCGRMTACTLQSEFQGSLRQSIALASLALKAPSTDPVELFLRTLGRLPTDAERTFAAKHAPDDLFWALLASRDFIWRR